MSEFEPVFLPADRALEGKASMTFLRHANRCPRSGFLYRKHGARGVQNTAMVRGTALHLILQLATSAMLEQGERDIPPEVCKAIVGEVLAELPLEMEEHDYLRECAYRWASQWRLMPEERVVAVETLYVLELGGWKVRCKVDFASVDEQNRVYVADYKSGRGAAAYDEISRKRPDVPDQAPGMKRLAAKSFQLIVYTLALVFGQPVTVEACAACKGSGQLSPLPPSGKGPVGCHECGGDGTVERVGEQVARGCQEAIAEYVYPGIKSSDGLMLRREMGLTRLEMLEYRESLETLLARLGAAERSGDWPAVVSDDACGECPCPVECPIPVELRDFAGSINTPEQAVSALSRRHVRQRKDRALGRELRKFVELQLGGRPLRYGNRVAELVPRESEEVKDKDGFYAALAGGMPLEEARDKFVKTSKGTSFAERDLTSEEIEKEAANGDRNGADRAGPSAGDSAGGGAGGTGG